MDIILDESSSFPAGSTDNDTERETIGASSILPLVVPARFVLKWGNSTTRTDPSSGHAPTCLRGFPEPGIGRIAAR